MDDVERARKGETNLDELNDLAKCGGFGTNKQNTFRDMMRKVQHEPKLAMPFLVEMPFVDPLGVKPTAILLPHEQFATIYSEYPEAFTKSVLPDVGHQVKFWTAVENHPLMVDNPIKTRADWKTHAIQ